MYYYHRIGIHTYRKKMTHHRSVLRIGCVNRKQKKRKGKRKEDTITNGVGKKTIIFIKK